MRRISEQTIKRRFRRWLNQPRNAERLLGATQRLTRRRSSHSLLVRCLSRLISHAFGVHELISPEWYRESYPDVVERDADPVLHYMCKGWRELRNPSPYFDTRAYLEKNPKVAAAGINPLVHLVIRGGPSIAAHRGRWQRSRPEKPALLFVVHELGGGTARFAAELADHVSDRAEVLFLRGRRGGAEICRDERGMDAIAYRLPGEIDKLCAKLGQLGVKRVAVIHSLTLHDHIQQILRSLALPFDFIALDYFCASPQYHLAGEDDRFLGEDRVPPSTWRTDSTRRFLIEQSQHLVACSQDLAQRLGRLGIARSFVVAPPPEPGKPHLFRCWPRRLSATEPTRVITIGSIRANKGRNIIVEVAQKAKVRQLPIQFHVYNEMAPPPPEVDGYLWLHGPDRGPLTTAICRIWPHIAWFPFQVPETHSFVLSDAMAHGLPILASAIGAIPERLTGRENTWMEKWDVSADQWLDRLMALRAIRFSSPGDGSLRTVDCSFYRSTFLDGLSASP